MPGLTADQISALAPDPASAKAGRELAAARKWLSLGSNSQAAWGECQGSAKDPYQTAIDLSGPAFKCTCPSRKFPCKHALGLFLLLAAQPGAFRQAQPPLWAAEWLAKRSQAAQKTEKPEPKIEKTADPAAQAKRAARREERVRQGLADLDLWLADLARQGLGAARLQSDSFWEVPAARLVDAQAPGLARRLREMATLPASGEGWQGRLLAQAGKLFLLGQAFSRLEQLPEALQEEVRTQIGWNQDQAGLLAQNGLQDCWQVLGRRVEDGPPPALGRPPLLKIQRTWLWGRETRRPALVLSFAAPGQVLDTSLLPGTAFNGEVVFFPGAWPVRGLVKSLDPVGGGGEIEQGDRPAAPAMEKIGFSSMLDATGAYADALAANPWLEEYPLALQEVLPYRAGDAWGVRDAAGRFLPFAPAWPGTWVLAGLSGGAPLDLFGEWNGETLWPLSAAAEGRFVSL